ncbi:ABC transporter substrate-binding protein [Microbacteriaceae bacterium VKM Ac-2854]|nr:ABC transporter substrate-binding protein [Microbacteriaceae bacterium VKM Ac-2854]
MKFRSRTTAVVAVIAAAALALTGCAGAAPAESGGGTASATLTLGSVNDIKSFDPAQAHLGHQMPIYQASYDTLILRSPEGELQPMLATAWEYNEDQTVLTLTLRDDVTFSDGAVFDAAAAKANLDHFMTANGPDAAQASSIDSVAVVDATHLTITLKAADPALTYYLSQAAGMMGSPEALGGTEIVTDPVGTGPYILDVAKTVPGSQFTFTANPDYWNPDLQKYGTVVFKVLLDVTARTNAVVSGQVDAALLDAKTGKQAEGAGLELTEYPVDWQGLYLFDRDGAIQPALSDVRVRQALNYAFDRETMLEQLALGAGVVTEQVFGSSTEAYDEKLNELYPYDPAKAKSLLAEAGYADGFTLTLPILPGTENIMAVVVQQLADIGVTVQQEAVPQANYVADISGAKYAAAWFSTFQGEPWVAIKQIVAPNAAYNPFKTTTPELQAMLDEVQAGGDESGALAAQVNEYVTENAWFVPFYTPNQMYYSNSSKVTLVPQIQQAVPNLYNYSPAS